MPDRKLSRVINLDDGTTLRTIDDAAKAIEKRFAPSLQWDPLTHAMRLLATAAISGKVEDIEAATDQLAMVLEIAPQTKKPRPVKPGRKR